MLRTTLTLALLVAFAPALADDELPGSTSLPERDRTPADLKISAVGGAFDGMGVRRVSGGVALFQLDYTPRFRSEVWELSVPLAFDHRQTFGTRLNQTVAAAGVEADFVGGGLHVGPLAGYSYTWRPGWPDLYQPNGAGGLYPTDRYSHSHWFAGGRLWSKFGGGRHLRIKARYSQYTYVRDPNYDPTVSLVHLVPRDYHELRVDASYRHVMHTFAWALRLDAYSRQYDVMLARKAFTGGTVSSNPHQELRGVEPRAEVEWRSKPFTVTLGYGYLWRDDPFQGYYSYAGHHPYVEAKGAITRALSYDAKASAKFLGYGSNSKAITLDITSGVYVPGTDDGKRLFDNRVELEAGLRYKLAKELSLVADAKWVRRATNYRDYIPGVYPPPIVRPYDTHYDIRWDFTNVMVTAGVEWRP